MHKILCIDDDPVFAGLYKDMLAPHGYQVDWKANIADGLDTALKGEHDLILLDVMMPEGGGIRDGFDLLERLRKTPDVKRVPVIMISSVAGDEDESHGMALGADAYIAKPALTPDVLASKVNELIAGK